MKQQICPIESGIKSKRLKWVQEPTFINWAWFKELREKDTTKKIYGINPYVEVYRFRENLYGLFAENADGMSDVWMYLIIGSEKALLIDTGFGIGDTKSLVDQITGGRPLYVVNTHGHYDHAYGNCRFEKVYFHKYELPIIQSQNSRMWDYLFDENGRCIWLEFDKKDLPVFREYETECCESGQVFNLGRNHEIEMIWLPGHSPGHSAFIDKKNRILFPGDAMSSGCSNLGTVNRLNTSHSKLYGEYAEYGNICWYSKQLVKLVKRMDEFDYVFPSHNIVNLEKGILQCILKTCNEILKNPKNYDRVHSYVNSRGELRELLVKYVEGYSSLAYML
jgi:glyoxylase-like metal-dependent hydrolase (beta-lactamase superfamily II)